MNYLYLFQDMTFSPVNYFYLIQYEPLYLIQHDPSTHSDKHETFSSVLFNVEKSLPKKFFVVKSVYGTITLWYNETMTEDISAVDRKIIRGLGEKTPREIAHELGMTPEEVLVRKDQILNEIDVLTIEQKTQKLLHDLTMIANAAWDKAKNVSDEFYSGTLNTAVNAQKEILRQIEILERRRESNLSQVDQLNRLRVRELIRLISVVMDELVPYFEAKYGADRDEIEGVFLEKLEVESRRMEEEAL